MLMYNKLSFSLDKKTNLHIFDCASSQKTTMEKKILRPNGEPQLQGGKRALQPFHHQQTATIGVEK